ncbi:MAG: hypothetical protein AB203_00790 [Parcubacteria bacterium C7867-008]|nr:MAG: hypothetical protein AB203_00790 [Parcubacteria bacterium C7867-008]
MKILLVEDTARHADDAINILQRAGIEFIHVKNLDFAEQALLKSEQYGITHVITDLFFPQGRSGNSNGVDNNILEPCGVAVMSLANAKGIPCVICTDGHHHGDRYDWVTQMGRMLDWPGMADHRRARTRSDVAETKDWEFALEILDITIPISV